MPGQPGTSIAHAAVWPLRTGCSVPGRAGAAPQQPAKPARSSLSCIDGNLGRPRQALGAPVPFPPHLSLPLGQGNPGWAQGRTRPRIRGTWGPRGGSQTLCPSVPHELPSRARGETEAAPAPPASHSCWAQLGEVGGAAGALPFLSEDSCFISHSEIFISTQVI